MSPRAHVIVAGAALSALCAHEALGQVTTLNLPPLNGYQPLVMFSMTDEQWGGTEFDLEAFFAHTGSTPGGNGKPSNELPITRPLSQQDWPAFVAVIDTGAQGCLLNYETEQMVNLAEAQRTGSTPIEIIGASGSEFAVITDPVGLYMTHLGNGQAGSASISGAKIASGSTLGGMWNVSMIATEAESVLPNIIGSPVVGLYQVHIKASQPKHVTIGTTTYKSPEVSFAPINTAIDNNVYGKIALTTTNVVGGPPLFVPSSLEDPADDPGQPTVWETLYANITTTHTAGSTLQSFLFDTGAQVSVISTDVAGIIGINTAGEDQTPPDFFTEILGVGGQIDQVPGYYINGMSISSTAGAMNFNSVPVIVLDLPDPRNPLQTLPGIIGTNLFTARDVIINVDTEATGNTGLYVSGPWAWRFNTNGNWSDATRWRLGLPNGVDHQANFFGAITTPRTVTVDGSGFTVGTVAFDNANRYTISGSQPITLDVSTGNAQINVHSGSHTINAPMVFTDDTEINVPSAASVLTINGTVTASGVKIIKGGDGTAEMKNIRADELQIDLGKMVTLANGGPAGTSKLASLEIAPGATLDLTDNDLIIDYTGDSPVAAYEALVASAYNVVGDWQGDGITSSIAALDGNYVVAIADNATLAVPFGTAQGGPLFSGVDVDLDTILIKFTHRADVDLDGVLTPNDSAIFGGNYSEGDPATWAMGDMDYDGVFTPTDAAIFGGFYDESLTSLPEPAVVGLLLMAGLITSRRRR